MCTHNYTFTACMLYIAIPKQIETAIPAGIETTCISSIEVYCKDIFHICIV